MKGKKTYRNKLKRIIIGFISVILVVFIGLLSISGIFVRTEYLKPWQKDYAKDFDDPRIQLAAHGILAANGHNMQPWIIRPDKGDTDVFYLYADSERFTNQVDPYARQMMVSQGTFLEYVSIAGDKLGYKTNIELYPEGSYDEANLAESMKSLPVAKITLAKSEQADNRLYDSIFLPDTNRSAYKEDKLTDEEKKQLAELNTDSSLSIEIFDDKENLDKLGNIVMEGITVESGTERVMKETEVIFRPNEYVKNKYRYGFSMEGQGTTGIMKHLMQGLVTVFPSLNEGSASADLFIKSGQTSADSTPAYILIKSVDNSRDSQVLSGMLYSRLIAAAHNLGLVMQPLSQPLEEYPEMETVYKQIHGSYASDGSTIQMLIRIGRPAKQAPRSMRRDVMSFIY